MEAKRMKMTPTMWEFMLDFISDHPEMATGKFEGPNGKQRMQKCWIELANKLNALGHGVKTPNKWQKSFADWKYNVKQKYAEIRTQRTKTGGGPSFGKKLTVQEERLMGLIGRSSLEGDGVVDEIGLGSQRPTIIHDIEAGPSTSGKEMLAYDDDIIYLPYSPPTEVVVSEGLSGPSSEASDVVGVSRPSTPHLTMLQPPAPQPSISTSLPHQPSRRPRGSVLEQFQAETICELRSGNDNLKSISSNIQRLADAIIDYLNKN